MEARTHLVEGRSFVFESICPSGALCDMATACRGKSQWRVPAAHATGIHSTKEQDPALNTSECTAPNSHGVTVIIVVAVL